MKIITTSLLAAGIILLSGWFNPAAAAEAAYGFDELYTKRIDLLTKHLAIYESVVDEASAGEAAKQWRALLPFEKEIHELNEKLGQPGEERLAELNEKYGNRLNGIANRSLQAGYALARKPYAKVLHIAQFENSVEIEVDLAP